MLFTHEFVEFIPQELEPERLYISMKYKTVTHLCACGCKREVTTPISPNDWRLTYDGKSISLRPSIGNWDFPCKSHYFVSYNQIEWAASWTKGQIKTTKENDKKQKEQYYNNKKKVDVETTNDEPFTLWTMIKNIF